MKLKLAALLTTTSLAMTIGAHAGEPDVFLPVVPEASTASSSGWEYSIAPYGLFSAIGGDITVGSLSADIDRSFSDIWDNLDAALIISGQARYNKFSFQADFIYMGLSGDQSLDRQNYDEVEVELDAIIFTLLGMYRTWENESSMFEMGGGVRLFNSDTELELKSSQQGISDVSSDSEVTIWDGVIAARLLYQFSPKWSLRFYGDVGAGDSDLTWQVWGNLGYQLSDSATLLAGYRHLAYDLGDGKTDIDLTFSGPQLGVMFKF